MPANPRSAPRQRPEAIGDGKQAAPAVTTPSRPDPAAISPGAGPLPPIYLPHRASQARPACSGAPLSGRFSHLAIASDASFAGVLRPCLAAGNHGLCLPRAGTGAGMPRTGRQFSWGTVVAWQPAVRLVCEWLVGDTPTELEVRFAADAGGAAGLACRAPDAQVRADLGGRRWVRGAAEGRDLTQLRMPGYPAGRAAGRGTA